MPLALLRNSGPIREAPTARGLPLRFPLYDLNLHDNDYGEANV